MIIMVTAVLALPGWILVSGVASGGSAESGPGVFVVSGIVDGVLMLAIFAPALKIVASRRSELVRPLGVAVVVGVVVAAHFGAWLLAEIGRSGWPTFACCLVAAGGAVAAVDHAQSA